MALNSTSQDDWSGASYTGRKAPGNAAYDLQNLLINDEGLPFKRGGAAYKSAADAAAAPEGLTDAYVVGGQRTVFWSETAEDVYVLDSDDSTVVAVSSSGSVWRKNSRGVVVGGLLWLPGVKFGGSSALSPMAYGGSRRTSDPALFSAAVTNGSKTVTSSGTSWTTTADAGMILQGVGIGITGVRAVVRRVVSNTELELVDGWTGNMNASATAALERFDNNSSIIDDANTDLVFLASAGQRLLAGQGNRVYFTPRNDPFGGDSTTDYHQLPEASKITGADSIRDIAVIFTTSGVWAISNLALDAVDDFGNVQQTVEQISKDVVLWGDPGIAGWSNMLVVPAVDDVYLFAPGSKSQSITGARSSQYDGGIRNLYRSYVSAGYQPGMASVHRGHYFLPILNGSALVDLLVCRLDRGFAWTRWAGHAASIACAQRVGSATRQPVLLGLAGERVTDLTGCFDPTGSNVTDADGTAPEAQITTRDYPTGQQPGFVTKIRGRYELDAFYAPLGPPWIADPWNAGDEPAETSVSNSSLIVGGTTGTTWRSYLSTPSSTVPLSIAVEIIGRPAVDIDAICSIIGFVQDPVAGSGYEARLRYEVAHDTVTIERYDNGMRTRILEPVNLAGRVAFGDTFEFRVAADGTLSVLVNAASVASVSDTTYFHAGEAASVVVGLIDVIDPGSRSGIIVENDALAKPLGQLITVEYSSDADGGTWHALSPLDSLGEQNGGPGWAVSDGSLYQFAKVGKKRERIRFRFTLVGACASFVWRSLEMLTRPSGKQ